ncbi:MAG: isoprenylcysteine carboxylmethyltransferase family protein, partial [Verrucomicrobiota bacterium]|nr:isoprenylcysteine carboxylmethyltransferase family protein [Verrucomicrobiota bacterium]
IVPAEEEFLRKAFCQEYRRYCAMVPRLVPRRRRWREAGRAEFDWSAVIGELRLGLVLVAIYLFLRGAAWLRGAA